MWIECSLCKGAGAISEKLPILDHGYLSLIETWGSDERIVEAARMSTGKGFQGWGGDPCEKCGGSGLYDYTDFAGDMRTTCQTCKGKKVKEGDEKLLRYLHEHHHATPFEMAGMVIEVQAPIMVFREWHRHRTQSYNEMSARYVPLPDVNYVPSVERLMMQGGANKQATGTGGKALSEHWASLYRELLHVNYATAENFYQDSLANGVPKELARLILPVGRYSRMRASANLRNWLAFLTLRMDTAAQWEIRQYANAVGELVRENFPRTWELFDEGRAK